MLKFITLISLLFLMPACRFTVPHNDDGMTAAVDSSSVSVDSSFAYADGVKQDSVMQGNYAKDHTNNEDTVSAIAGASIDVKKTRPDEVVSFAETLVGTPYRYGSTDPTVGFDCSGFITYVFHHFNIAVPRSSIDFTHVGKDVALTNCKRGDIILFTGTDSSEHFVGHMGIITANTDSVRFIHSTSGRQHGVTITALNNYYKGRFIKTIRVFKENDD